MKRLDLIVDFVDSEKVVCDVGTDHGITALKIYEEKSPKKVIATDISGPSLQKLRDKLKVLDYDIETIVTDGIPNIDIDIDIIIISGMGGFLISKIIEKGSQVAQRAERLILQANNSLSHLRHFLLDNAFEIIDEKIAFEDGIYYDIIVASYSGEFQKSYDKDFFYEYGKHIIEKKDPLLPDKLNDIKSNLLKIRSSLKDINTQATIKRLREIDDELLEIGEVEDAYKRVY